MYKTSKIFEVLLELDRKPFHQVSSRILHITIALFLFCRIIIEIKVADFLYSSSGILGIRPSTPFFPFSNSAMSIFLTWIKTFPHFYIFYIIWFCCGVFLLMNRFTLFANLTASFSLYVVNSLLDLGDGSDYIVKFYALAASLFLIKSNKISSYWKPRIFLHNLSILFCYAQTCLIYIDSSFGKLEGSFWRNGTALYYVMNSDSFGGRSLFISEMFKNPVFVTFSTYLIIVFQSTFLFAIFTRLRIFWILFGLFMHIFIAIFLGLFPFGLMMCGILLIFVRDSEWKTIFLFFNHLFFKDVRNV
jgi:hypothetical protein